MPATHELRLAFWNTWLLRPRLWPGGPSIPGSDRFFAPDVVRRASLVGEALSGRFDVCALAECFEPSEQAAVRTAWPDHDAAAGPQRTFPRFTGSGLLTIVDRSTPAQVSIEASIAHRYRAGGDLRDSDTFATKGALLTRLRIGGPAGPGLDLVSTHLFAGGDLLPVPGADDHLRHHAVRLDQLDELAAFVAAERDPRNPLLVVGDLNVAAHDPNPALADPRDHYRDLHDRLAPLGLRDLWAQHATARGPGHTCTFAHAADLPPRPGEPDAVADDPTGDPATAPGERIDYLWLADAAPDATTGSDGTGASPDTDTHTDTDPGTGAGAGRDTGGAASVAPTAGATTVEVGELHRWAFSGRPVTGGPAGSLSDHLALSATLTLTGP